MKLSIIIPVYNEKGTILEILKRINNVVLGLEKEIIIVDDFSNDGTSEILKSLDKNLYSVIFKNKNEGKGSAIKAGLKRVTGDIILFQDADLEYDPSDYPAMIAPIINGKTEVVLGVRIEEKRKILKYKSLYFFISFWGGKFITFLTNLLFWNNASEYEGCYKAFTRDVLSNVKIKSNGFQYDNELICKILKKGYKTVDVPIKYFPRDYEQGKHIRFKDGFLILWTIIKYRFIN